MKDKFKILFIKAHTKSINQSVGLPLGVLYLSSYLKKHLNDQIEIKFIDLRVEKQKNHALFNMLDEFKPNLVGISMLAFEMASLSEYTTIIRKVVPRAKIIVGGPASTFYHDDIARNNIECAVISEGENILLNIVRNYMNGADIKDIKGIVFSNNGNIVCNPMENYIDDLDSIPFPDYSLIDFKKYWNYHYHANFILAHKNHAFIMGSRGCPYKCIFCHNMFGRKIRANSPEYFFNNMKLLYDDYGVREFHIVDDFFNFDRERMHNIFRLIIDSNIKIKLSTTNALRGDILNEDDLLLFKKAGGYKLAVSIETASERMQKLIKKNLNVEKTIKNVEFAYKIGLITRGAFMIGFPGETLEEIKGTLLLARKMKIDIATIFFAVPYKNTELFSIAKDMYPDLNDIEYRMDFHSKKPFYTKVTGQNINFLHKMGYIRFYASPRTLNLLWKVPKKLDFLYHFIYSSLSLLINR